MDGPIDKILKAIQVIKNECDEILSEFLELKRKAFEVEVECDCLKAVKSNFIENAHELLTKLEELQQEHDTLHNELVHFAASATTEIKRVEALDSIAQDLDNFVQNKCTCNNKPQQQFDPMTPPSSSS